MTTETQTQTRQIVRAYFDAWTSGNVSACGQYFADDLAYEGALTKLNSAADYLISLGNFRKLVTTGIDLISELYGDDEASLIYDTHTMAGTIRIAEHVRLTNNKISSLILIFDPRSLLEFKAKAGQ